MRTNHQSRGQVPGRTLSVRCTSHPSTHCWPVLVSKLARTQTKAAQRGRLILLRSTDTFEWRSMLLVASSRNESGSSTTVPHMKSSETSLGLGTGNGHHPKRAYWAATSEVSYGSCSAETKRGDTNGLMSRLADGRS